MEGRYSTRSPAVKRLMREAQELCEPTDQYFAQPLEDNLFEWHFTIRGPLDSDFQAGLYHGRIILPVDYPMKPPSIIWLTPNGRFETNKKICLSISGHHPESWQPSWSIRTALLAIIGFMPTHPGGAIGSLDYKPEERKALAKKSRDWKCPVCGDVSEILLEPSPESNQTSQEAKELASQISFQGEKPKTAEKSKDETAASSPPTGDTTTIPSTEGASATASSTTTAASTPLDTPPTSAGQPPVSGNMYPPWACPPGLPTSNSAMPPPFMPYPWSCLSMPQGGQLAGIASQIPRFPYPPSYYANNAGAFYPTGFPFPSSMGMFPCPFPPPPTTFGHNLAAHNIHPPVSVNNSSLSPPNRSPDRGSHSHSPDAPRIPSIPPPSPASVVSSQAGNSAPVSPQCSPLKEHVLNELLSKVKRVGSDVLVPSNAAMDSDIKREAIVNSQIHVDSDSAAVKEIPESCVPCKQAAELISAETNSSEVIPDVKLEDAKEVQDVLGGPDHATSLEPLTSQIVNISTISEALKCAFDVTDEMAETNSHPRSDGLENQQDGGENNIGDQCLVEDKSQVTDTDISVSLMRKESINESTGMEISHSELSADPGDDGELGNLALEVSETEQRSHFERSTSSSMPDLKKKLKLGTVKGLRQRQSAFARVPCETAADEQTLSEQASSGSGRQRIEAVSGDSFANQQRFHQNAANAENEAAQNRANLAYQVARRTPERQANSTFDVSFMVMIGLCLTTVFILVNRLFYLIDFSSVFY